MYELSVRTHFSAAHHLRGYEGTCAAFHGHNWLVDVFVRGEKLNDSGLLVDFRQLKQAVREVLKEVDHTDLNQHPFFAKNNPSSEHIAAYLYRKLSDQFNGAICRVHRVTVYETPEACATYWEQD